VKKGFVAVACGFVLFSLTACANKYPVALTDSNAAKITTTDIVDVQTQGTLGSSYQPVSAGVSGLLIADLIVGVVTDIRNSNRADEARELSSPLKTAFDVEYFQKIIQDSMPLLMAKMAWNGEKSHRSEKPFDLVDQRFYTTGIVKIDKDKALGHFVGQGEADAIAFLLPYCSMSPDFSAVNFTAEFEMYPNGGVFREDMASHKKGTLPDPLYRVRAAHAVRISGAGEDPEQNAKLWLENDAAALRKVTISGAQGLMGALIAKVKNPTLPID